MLYFERGNENIQPVGLAIMNTVVCMAALYIPMFSFRRNKVHWRLTGYCLLFFSKQNDSIHAEEGKLFLMAS